jgi:hypothetical protein
MADKGAFDRPLALAVRERELMTGPRIAIIGSVAPTSDFLVQQLGVVHSESYRWVTNIGGVSFVVAISALVMRVKFKRERAIAEGNPPKELGLRGLRPAKSHRWWIISHLVRSSAGWQTLERASVVVAWVGASVFVVGIIAIAVIGH